VGREEFSFDGIDEVEERIREIADQLSYVAVWDRSDRKVEEPVGRFDFDPDRALPWLVQEEEERDDEPAEEGDLPREADTSWPSDAEEGDDGPQPRSALARATGGPGNAKRYVGAADLARACCRWLRALAVRNTVGWPHRRFRVRLCGPKGISTLESGSFLCRNHGYEDEIDEAAVRDLKIPTPTFEQAATTAVTRPMQSLGDYYAQWGKIVLGAVGELQGVNNVMLNRLHRQLTESRDQVDQLVAAILNARVQEAEAAGTRDLEERKGDARTALARDALHQLGEAARAFLVAKGINPEMTEVVSSMGTCPDLVAALNDPEVKGLMQNPENLKVLASMLRGAAAQARAARQIADQAGAEPANGQPAPDATSAAA
jgi:hypothetical protein